MIILDAGRATLELFNTAQVEMIDRLEVGHRVSPKFRVAFEVTDGARCHRPRRGGPGGADRRATPEAQSGARFNCTSQHAG